MNDDAATVATTGGGARALLGPHPAGDVPDDDEGECPASGDVVGRRGEVEHHARGEAEHGGELGAAGQRGADDDQQAEVGHDALPREVREERHLEDQRQRDGRDRGGDPEGSHRRLPSASITPRSLRVPEGTTTPTRSRLPKSTNGSITARWVDSRTLL